MTNANKQEGNKLIAEFMGWHFEPAFSDVNTTRHNRWITPHSPAWTTDKQMAFHSSWDWLMPVIGKIENKYNLFTQYEPIEKALCSIQIDSAWIAVVEFIRWHNIYKNL